MPRDGETTRPDVSKQSDTALKIFVAAPMSGFGNDAEFQQAKADIHQLSDNLLATPHVDSVYFAGSGIDSVQNFSPSNNALISDITAIVNADRFIFVYPREVLTSALVEVGYALGRNIRSHFFVKNLDHLPYLLKDCHKVSSTFEHIPRISISTYTDGAELARKAKDRLLDD